MCVPVRQVLLSLKRSGLIKKIREENVHVNMHDAGGSACCGTRVRLLLRVGLLAVAGGALHARAQGTGCPLPRKRGRAMAECCMGSAQGQGPHKRCTVLAALDTSLGIPCTPDTPASLPAPRNAPAVSHATQVLRQEQSHHVI